MAASPARTIAQILLGGIATSGTVVSGIALKNRINMQIKENNQNWFNGSTSENGFYDKFEISSFNDEDAWEERYKKAKADYDFDKSHKLINYSLDHMEQGREKFRDFCYAGLSDLKSKGVNPAEFLQESSSGEWIKKWEYWPWCINIKFSLFEELNESDSSQESEQ